MKPQPPIEPGQAFSPPTANIRPEEGSYRRHHQYVERREPRPEQRPPPNAERCPAPPAMEDSHPRRDMHNYNFSRRQPLHDDEARHVTHQPDPYRYVEPEEKPAHAAVLQRSRMAHAIRNPSLTSILAPVSPTHRERRNERKRKEKIDSGASFFVP
ncbi:putative Zinc knuckle containing protein [Rhodotorula toruloides ATCC 204091]|uniref:Putative zinc knuckle-containing protein n=1 Tax=Rhodotorula toruloides TaxID=5286 RepID=A0A2S9ZW70_RHOTO|nr:putative Zinc knuckle containing protein [Rhodotorula toruloides ATCC 204091]PRQ70001.1 putative zinc knuckle-containing protein [Rhodotorula toruloides]